MAMCHISLYHCIWHSSLHTSMPHLISIDLNIRRFLCLPHFDREPRVEGTEECVAVRSCMRIERCILLCLTRICLPLPLHSHCCSSRRRSAARRPRALVSPIVRRRTLGLLCSSSSLAAMSAAGGASAEFALHQPPTDGITHLAFGNKSDVLLAASWDKVRHHHRAETRCEYERASSETEASHYRSPALFDLPSTRSSLQSVRLYDTLHNVMRLQIPHTAAVMDVCFDDDDRRAFSGGLEQKVEMHDLTTSARSTPAQ
jgi:hypothetical protein